MRRVGVYVNVSNQFAALSEKKKGYRVNYEKYLSSVLDSNDTLILAIAYGSQISDEATAFIHVLKKLGYITKFASSRQENREIRQPNRNVEITIDILDSVNKLDTIVIGSNDPELIPLIHKLRLQGITVIVSTPFLLHTEGSVNIDLITNEDIVEYIQVMRDKKHDNATKS